MDKVTFMLDRLRIERKIAMLSTQHDGSVPHRDLRALAGDRVEPCCSQMGDVKETANKGEAASTVEAPERQ